MSVREMGEYHLATKITRSSLTGNFVFWFQVVMGLFLICVPKVASDILKTCLLEIKFSPGVLNFYILNLAILTGGIHNKNLKNFNQGFFKYAKVQSNSELTITHKPFLGYIEKSYSFFPGPRYGTGFLSMIHELDFSPILLYFCLFSVSANFIQAFAQSPRVRAGRVVKIH